ncbi:MAG: hypothetical protein OJF48_002755 [Afipia sp.]|nr:MAG: hypothetical protein OJF48_002755 [Afipia sp.]
MRHSRLRAAPQIDILSPRFVGRSAYAISYEPATSRNSQQARQVCIVNRWLNLQRSGRAGHQFLP